MPIRLLGSVVDGAIVDMCAACVCISMYTLRLYHGPCRLSLKYLLAESWAPIRFMLCIERPKCVATHHFVGRGDGCAACCMSHWYICVTNGLSRDGEDERRARRGPDMRPAATAGQGEGPVRWLDPNRSSRARAVDARRPLPWSQACWWYVAERLAWPPPRMLLGPQEALALLGLLTAALSGWC